MNRKGDKSLIVGLDIGTSKVTALVGEHSPGLPVEVIGVGSHESRGLRRGVVVDIDSTVQSIQRAVEEAELMAGCEIRSVYASISGNHVQCRNSQGMEPLRDGEVNYSDMDRALEAAKAVAIPSDQRILHAIAREYVLDSSQEGIKNPVGMSGIRLEVHAHLVTCAQSAAQNIMKCVQRCGLSVDDLILSALASSEAVLTDDERELGVVLVDIGKGALAAWLALRFAPLDGPLSPRALGFLAAFVAAIGHVWPLWHGFRGGKGGGFDPGGHVR